MDERIGHPIKPSKLLAPTGAAEETILTSGRFRVYTQNWVYKLAYKTALSKRLPLHMVNHKQLPYRCRYGTGTNTYFGTRPYRTLQYVRHRYLLKAHLAQSLRDTHVHGLSEATSQSAGVTIK